jgi:pimeloyl-ACP methyl ester carboxylesterase
MARLAAIEGRYMYVEFEGVEHRVYFEQAGQGVPVLLQHTAGSDSRQWRHLLEDPELTSRFRFIAYDLPFHGRSVPPVGPEWWTRRYELHQKQFMAMIVGIADELELERPVFMGCSMGGHIAPDLALHYPGRFCAVIAVQGGIATHDEEPFNDYMWHPRVSDELKASLMYTLMSPQSPEPLRRETSWVYSQGAPPVHQGDLVFYLGEHDLTETAHLIDTTKTAVHVVSGDYDWSATPERCKALADAITGAHYHPMRNLGHFPMSENPEAFKACVGPILDEIAAGLTTKPHEPESNTA